MKTEKIMERRLEGVVVRQSTEDTYFNANDMLNLVNSNRLLNGQPTTTLDSYYKSTTFKEFANNFEKEEGIPIEDAKKTRRGKYKGGTWMHPLLFLDFALWASSDFRYKVIKWLYDDLIASRIESGNSFLPMNIALDKAYKIGGKSGVYVAVAKKIKNAIGVKDWESATKEQLDLRTKVLTTIEILADVKPFKTPMELADYVLSKEC